MVDFSTLQKACVFLTRKCNMSCRGCNVINYQSQYELSTEEWFNVFDILKKLKVGFVVLFGGEPTLREDLPNLITYLNKLSLPHTVITNSVKLLRNDKFYNSILESKPYGISVSVNGYFDKPKFDDEVKSNAGYKLLQKLRNDGYDGDLVANTIVHSRNLINLPNLVEFFSNEGIWSILTILHLTKPHQASYWWYRGIIDNSNKDLRLTRKDKRNLSETADFFLENYDNLLLHNSKEYFRMWRTNLPIQQDWRCKYLTTLQVNSDGSLMACIDRPLTEPVNILELQERKKDFLRSFHNTIVSCPGCVWDHMWESNMYAGRGKVSMAKRRFAHVC